MKRIIIVAVAIMALATDLQAQRVEKIRNHNLIFNVDVTSGNVYAFAASSAVTGLANYYLFRSAFFENSFAYSFYSTNVSGLDARTLNPMGMTARELLGNIGVGLKLGYQTYHTGFFNYGAYATAHYKSDRLKVGYDSDSMTHHHAQRALLGGAALLSLGSMEQPSRVIVEAGLRYSLPIAYSSPESDDNIRQAGGLATHFGVKLASRGLLQNVGLFADIDHFSRWKNHPQGHKLKDWSIGITWTITCEQADNR